RITGRNLKEAAVQRVIALTEQKYCSTLNTLERAVEISSRYEIVENDDSSQAMSAAGRAAPSPVALATRFNEALNAGDVDAMMALMSEDCTFENTFPAPDGTRYEGKPAVRAFWEAFMQNSRQPRIETEEAISMGDRCVLRWTYHWQDAAGNPGHVRGVDIFRIRNGLIQEKLSYVKG
ncbi:MAG TPA: nuclear transport factor 2 family protein, partial [Anaerolineaceae bacterium]|nr:nuclear transport factor 2 family protein [Anaerolineaceae bacterium]